MDKKINNLSITTICLNDINHLTLKRHLSYDNDFQEYLYKNIDKYFLEPISDSDSLQENTSYLVKKNDKLVGFVHICKIIANTISFHYAVSPSERGKGIGTDILKELPILIYNDIDPNLAIQLKINMYNHASQKAAKKASYTFLGRDNDDYIFETSEKTEKKI